MRISVTKYGDAEDLLTLEISSDMTIRDLKAVIESESDFGIPSNEMTLYHDGKPSNPKIPLILEISFSRKTTF